MEAALEMPQGSRAATVNLVTTRATIACDAASTNPEALARRRERARRSGLFTARSARRRGRLPSDLWLILTRPSPARLSAR